MIGCCTSGLHLAGPGLFYSSCSEWLSVLSQHCFAICTYSCFCYITNLIKFKTYKRARDTLVAALLSVRTPRPNCGLTPPPLAVQWHDCLLSLRYCFHCHFLILVYGPRCWQRGAIPQKRHFRAASDVLCGVELLKQQTHTLPTKTPCSRIQDRNVAWACGNLFCWQ